MYKFKGSLAELQQIVAACKVRGKWQKSAEHHYYRFISKTKTMVLNWWPSTGTINFQGKRQERFMASFLKHAADALSQSDADSWEELPAFQGSGKKKKTGKAVS
jgi:ribonuclease HIII